VHLLQCSAVPIFLTIQPIGCDGTSALKKKASFLRDRTRQMPPASLPPSLTIDSDFAAEVPARHRKGNGPRPSDAMARLFMSGFTKACMRRQRDDLRVRKSGCKRISGIRQIQVCHIGQGSVLSTSLIGCVVARLQMRSKGMKEKKHIVEDWLPRYTGTPACRIRRRCSPDQLRQLRRMVRHGARRFGSVDRPMPNVTADGITLINFVMGSPNAATVMDLLSAIAPAALFLGKCGGLKRKNQIGDLILPIAAIRGEGTSNDYLAPEVPAPPAFQLQRAVSTMIRDLGHDY
jgi:hypothetical protein